MPLLRRLQVYNCLSGAFWTNRSWPCGLTQPDLWTDGEADSLRINLTKGISGPSISPAEANLWILNGTLLANQAQLDWNSVHTLVGPDLLCLLLPGQKPPEWDSLMKDNWYVQWSPGGKRQGPFGWNKLLSLTLSQDPQSFEGAFLYPGNLEVGFGFKQVLPLLRRHQKTESDQALTQSLRKSSEKTVQEMELAFGIDTGNGDLISPFSWERFSAGDILHIASHPSLRGDPYLGEEEALRFHATRFTDEGHAIDPMGGICQELACPHTHLPLPPGFLERDQRILSLVGAPSAGKSYYLCVLTRMLSEGLYRHFGYTFKDADPTANAHFNSMKLRLFNGGSSEEAALVKTRLDGEMYRRIEKEGRRILLPRPFTYVLQGRETETNIIFYDNAGEHFEPGRDSNESPGGRHVAFSDALFFLFDPVASKSFRDLLSDHEDPQLKLRAQADQQDILIAETEVRIRKLLRLPTPEKWKRPCAFLLGKSDIWLSRSGVKLRDPLENGEWNPSITEENSVQLREFLREMAPLVVSNIESFAGNVRYFAVSSFGHSPMILPNGALAPDPNRLRPSGVEIPFLWTLDALNALESDGRGIDLNGH